MAKQSNIDYPYNSDQTFPITMDVPPVGGTAGWVMAFSVFPATVVPGVQPVALKQYTTGGGSVVNTDTVNGVWNVTIPDADMGPGPAGIDVGTFNYSFRRTDSPRKDLISYGTFTVFAPTPAP